MYCIIVCNALLLNVRVKPGYRMKKLLKSITIVTCFNVFVQCNNEFYERIISTVCLQLHVIIFFSLEFLVIE